MEVRRERKWKNVCNGVSKSAGRGFPGGYRISYLRPWKAEVPREDTHDRSVDMKLQFSICGLMKAEACNNQVCMRDDGV